MIISMGANRHHCPELDILAGLVIRGVGIAPSGVKMPAKSPTDTMRELIAAFNAADVDGAIALYHSDAGFVLQPGQTARGLV